MSLGTEPDDTNDPDATPPKTRKLVTQPYDLSLEVIINQIENKQLHLRPLSDKPNFQRRYVWNDVFASRLVESILLNVPIPQCFFAQDEDFNNEVIDGQQRLYSLYRFIKNQFRLKGLETMTELNGEEFYKLDSRLQAKIRNFIFRCVVILNDSDQDLKFDVFERLNSNTKPLNAQELRNCIYRGSLIDTLESIAATPLWLGAVGRKSPDPRMKDEEAILRFYAFRMSGLAGYRTPQKYWLNEVAKVSRNLSEDGCAALLDDLTHRIFNARNMLGDQAFRKEPGGSINRALLDLTLLTLCQVRQSSAQDAGRFRQMYSEICHDAEFTDLISRAVDHVKRTKRRFELWNVGMDEIGFPRA